ncbi:Copine-domain-containing protein [Catenaria anguillulae PL171]|uniref:Copine-domain-containing protein n=1 Tax=Catenaria anguillulae PL171 TaxID=765915 RepID=A0A1Y2HVV6_9FUNG|nr:Copine-domain-containing protein [Catenaria anguillulae PL171]
MPTPVHLFVSCSGLIGHGITATDKPSAVVYLESVPESGQPCVIACTDMVRDSATPTFSKPIIVTYAFESIQRFRFVVVDMPASKSPSTSDYNKNDVIGICCVTLGQIMCASSGSFSAYLDLRGKTNGMIKIRPVPQENIKTLKLTLHGTNLDKKDFLGKSDPYIIISRLEENGEKRKVYETEIIRNTLNPEWLPIELPVGQLVDVSKSDHMNRSIVFDCYDWDRDTSHDHIGSATCKLSALTTGVSIPLLNYKKLKSSSYKNSGCLFIQSAEIVREYTFHDYISGGTDVSVGVAIDFSSHCGNISNPNSLHFVDRSGAWNDTMRALDAVLSVLEPYDTDRAIPLYGFGAELPGPMAGNTTDFHVNGDPNTPYIYGRSSALAAYSNCVPRLTQVDQAYLAPIISRFSYTLEQSQNPRSYMILLVLTQGKLADFEATMEALIHASTHAMSVVIVGLGPGDHEQLYRLDGDDKKLITKDGRYASRDIVQFVPFNKYTKEVHRGEALARDGTFFQHRFCTPTGEAGGNWIVVIAVLHEIPDQLVSYMKSKGIVPVNVKDKSSSNSPV